MMLVLLSIVFCLSEPVRGDECYKMYQLESQRVNCLLEWTLKGNVIDFTVSCTVQENDSFELGVWIGLGFSNKTETPFMFPADVIIGSFPITESGHHIQDMYTVDRSGPIMDTTSNIMATMNCINDTVLTMSFSRSIVSPDKVHDVSLDEPRYWIWAVGPLGASGEDLSTDEFVLDMHVERGIVLNSTISLPSASKCLMNGYCNSESTEGPTGTITWPESTIGTTVSIPCPFGPTNVTVSRTCVSQSNWSAIPETSKCATIVTKRLQMLGDDIDKINTSNVAEFTSDLSSFVENSSSMVDQTEQNVLVISLILIRAWELFQAAPNNFSLSIQLEIISEILDILDNIEEWYIEILRNQSHVIIQTFETFACNLVSQENFTNLTVVTRNITFFANRLNAEYLEKNGKAFTVNKANSGELEVSAGNQPSGNLHNDHSAILSFPSGVDIQELVSSNKEDVGIFFIAYDQDSLFFDATHNNLSEDQIGSAIVGFTISSLPVGTILPKPISINLRIEDPITGSSENISNATCVFYNFETLMWDPEGCETIYDPDYDPSIVTCRCTHLTNFACLVNIHDRLGSESPSFTKGQLISLDVISYMGIVLSLVGLLVTFISLIIFKKIRQHDVTKFHLQLCVALACMYLVFVCGIDSTDNRGGCVTVGTMIQYFTLVAWMWMGAEALLMFQQLVLVFFTTTWKYLLLVSIVCWSVPIVPVVIPVAIDPDYYITTYDDNTTRAGFCFISNVGVFFGAFLGPIFLVIIFNTVVFVFFLHVLLKHYFMRNKYKLDQPSMTALDLLKMFLSIFGVMVLFGFLWILAIFTFTTTNRDASYIFQLMFIFFSAFQGFWIFLFFVVVNTETRQSWKKFLCSFRKKSSQYDVTSKPTTGSTINDVNSSVYLSVASLVASKVLEQSLVLVKETTLMDDKVENKDINIDLEQKEEQIL